MIKQVISGGQIGANIAGLRAAQSLGIETGGFAPRTFRTIKGPNPSLGSEYGLIETETTTYPPRTFANVKNSDGTIRFALFINNPGELCTMEAIKQYKKPWFDVTMDIFSKEPLEEPTYDVCVKWIEENKIEVLNIAGNPIKSVENIIENYVSNVIIHCNKMTLEP